MDTDNGSGSTRRVLGPLALVPLLAALAAFWFYGLNSTHETAESLGAGRIRDLTPPTARGITLHRDFLDHFATYTVAEKDLTAFLRYGFGVEDPLRERSPVAPDAVGHPIGRLGWTVPEGCVVYSVAAANGGVSTYYHDPASGSTYQESAHW